MENDLKIGYLAHLVSSRGRVQSYFILSFLCRKIDNEKKQYTLKVIHLQNLVVQFTSSRETMAEAEQAQAVQDLLDRQIAEICEKLNNLRKREKEINDTAGT